MVGMLMASWMYRQCLTNLAMSARRMMPSAQKASTTQPANVRNRGENSSITIEYVTHCRPWMKMPCTNLTSEVQH